MKTRNKKTLWTKNYTVLILGTLVSAIGSTAMNFVMGLVVFDNTASTWLSGLFMAVSMIPNIVLPILIAPYMDRCSRKKVIVGLDLLSGVLYLGFAWYLSRQSFSYILYLSFSLITGAIGSTYSLAYNALYPDLITKGFEQKGYSIASLIYPSVTALFLPGVSILYKNYGMTCIVFMEGILLLIASAFETQIKITESQVVKRRQTTAHPVKEYVREVMGGVEYVKKEIGIRNIYLYMAITNACGQGTSLMTMAYFQSNTALGTAMYSLLISAETVGRMIGGITHYFIKIPEEKRFQITEKVYLTYQTMDGILLFIAYPLMLCNRFLCGFLGVNSATLREAAVQRYLPSNMRARINALFSVLVSLGMFVVQMGAGILGEIISYRMVTVIFASFGFFMAILLIVKKRVYIEPIYESKKDV